MNPSEYWLFLLVTSSFAASFVTHWLSSWFSKRRFMLSKLEEIYRQTCSLYHNVMLRLDNAERSHEIDRIGQSFRTSSALEVRQLVDEILMNGAFYHRDLLPILLRLQPLFDEHNKVVELLRSESLTTRYLAGIRKSGFETRWEEACDDAKVNVHVKANTYILPYRRRFWDKHGAKFSSFLDDQLYNA